MKKAICVIILLAMYINMLIPTHAVEINSLISVKSSDLLQYSYAAGIASDDGVASIDLICKSTSAATYRIEANCYIEKSVNGSWVRMILENGSKYWIVNQNGKEMNLTVEQTLTAGKGQYRVTVIFTVISGMGTESATHIDTFNYT